TQDKSFTTATVSGLVVWERPDVAVARVGPKTLAVGSLGEVKELVEVRLGTRPDLKIDDPLLKRFQALDANSALRLVSQNPTDLTTLFGPIFPPELLQSARFLGLEMALATPAKAHLFVRVTDQAVAKEWATRWEKETTRWLTIPGSDYALTTEPPK